MENNMITISAEEYKELLEDSVKLKLLRKSLFNKARKGYSEGELRFDDVEKIMWAIFPEECKNKYIELTEDANNEKKADNAD